MIRDCVERDTFEDDGTEGFTNFRQISENYERLAIWIFGLKY